uniref:Transmembrane protein n=1 Tax=Angiostrongylus cantonensis TaxID=6313 RepID=A0A0K0D5R5_ANGCA
MNSSGDIRLSEKSVCERGNSTTSTFVDSQFEEIPAWHSSLLCEIGRCVDWVLVRGRWTLAFDGFCEMRDNFANRVVILMIPASYVIRVVLTDVLRSSGKHRRCGELLFAELLFCDSLLHYGALYFSMLLTRLP